MAEIKKLQVDGADIYPVTHESAVYDNEGKSIESKYLSSVAYTQGDDIQISGGSSEGGGSVDTSELEAKIEEVEETANWCRMAIGDGNQLLTNNKNSVVEAINEVFQYGNNVKQNLVDALIAKGVQASTSETFDSLIAKLNDIQDGSNPYNIITASSLPATGKENQLCVITSEASSEFYFNASTTTVPSNAITFVCLSGDEANYSVTSDNVTIHYNISYSEQNGTVRPVYLYKNGQWIALALANTSLLENGIINPGVNDFYRVDPSYDNFWKYTQGTGLYTAGLSNNYYSSLTTTQTLNFDEYNSIQVTGYLSRSSTYGLALFKNDRSINQLHGTEDYTTITDYQRFNTTSTTVTYDITSWSGRGYLGLVKYNADSSVMYITDIKLMKASNPGEGSGGSGGSGVTTGDTILFNSSTDNVGFSRALWTSTDADANDLLNVGINSYNKAYVGLDATRYSSGDIGAVRLYKTLQNFSVSQLQSFTYCKIKYTMSYNYSTTWDTYYAPTFGFTDGLYDDSMTLPVSKTEQVATLYFSKIHQFDRYADLTMFFTMPLVGGENIRFTITEITLYGDSSNSATPLDSTEE